MTDGFVQNIACPLLLRTMFTIIPFFDALLHCITGFVFACIGFAVPKLFVGEPQSGRMLAVCLLFGFFFSLAIAVLWELFEFAGTSLLGFDMQEDTVVDGFGSYLLSGTHSELGTKRKFRRQPVWFIRMIKQ